MSLEIGAFRKQSVVHDRLIVIKKKKKKEEKKKSNSQINLEQSGIHLEHWIFSLSRSSLLLHDMS